MLNYGNKTFGSRKKVDARTVASLQTLKLILSSNNIMDIKIILLIRFRLRSLKISERSQG